MGESAAEHRLSPGGAVSGIERQGTGEVGLEGVGRRSQSGSKAVRTFLFRQDGHAPWQNS